MDQIGAKTLRLNFYSMTIFGINPLQFDTF